MPWYVLYVKPRNEKKVARDLTKLGLNVYCPLKTTYRQWTDRIKKVDVPIINSYLFINIDENNRQQVFQSPGAIRYIYWLGKPAVVRECEIQQMKQWLKGDLEEAVVEQLKPGDRYAVSKGPFKGQEGIVQEVRKNRLQLILVSLGIKITLIKQAA